MPRIFNTIRHRLPKENRLTGYLTYAVGEIVLVVVGILIAHQINNWNEGRKRMAVEHKMLLELCMNLRMDSADHAANGTFYTDVWRSTGIVV